MDALSFIGNQTRQIDCDVLVIGAGIGGCCAAITAKESGLTDTVVLVEKSHAGKTGPSAFVGGVYRGELPEDDPDEMLKKEMERLSYIVDQEALERLILFGPQTVANLEKWGVTFSKEPDGNYSRVFQRGFQTMRIEGGGLSMMNSLERYASKLGVQIINWVTITDLLKCDGHVVGAVGIHCRTGEFFCFRAKSTILATGGTMFKTRQPGHRQLSGDGWAMAYRCGAEIAGMDSSISNMYGATLEVGPGNGLYLSFGARLLNRRMQEYIKNYPGLEEMRSPESQSPLMAMETLTGNAPPVYLDMRHLLPEQVQIIYENVPYAAKRWEKLGFLKNRRFVKLCEYAPEGPRPQGGVYVDSFSFESASIPGLFGCGEAVTGMQVPIGLNYAASSGMLAGRSAAEKAIEVGIVSVASEEVKNLKDLATTPMRKKQVIDSDYVLTMLQETLHPYYVHILRSEKSLKRAIAETEDIAKNLVPQIGASDPHLLRIAHDIRNMALCAEMFLKSALARKESRFSPLFSALREDYPYTDNKEWLKMIKARKHPRHGGMDVVADDIPIDKYKLKPGRDKALHPFWKRAIELGYWSLPKGE